MHPKKKLNATQNMEKVKVSQDFLYQYLVEHNFILSVLNKRMGVSNGILMGCFHHAPNSQGKPMKFSAANIEKMNMALSQIAEELRGCMLTYGSDQVVTKVRGGSYDPALVQPIREQIGNYFKTKTFLERVLGWNAKRWNAVLSSPSSKVYGQVTAEDADRINADLLAVIGVLSNYEVVADGNDTIIAE